MKIGVVKIKKIQQPMQKLYELIAIDKILTMILPKKSTEDQ
jgi:hypothetical protein